MFKNYNLLSCFFSCFYFVSFYYYIFFNFEKLSSFSSGNNNNAGKDSFMWIGPTPRVSIRDPEHLKDIFIKFGDFPKPHSNPLGRLLAAGVASYEGDKWAKHRKIINPAFHMEKLKVLIDY